MTFHNFATKPLRDPFPACEASSGSNNSYWHCLQDEIILGMMSPVISLSGASESVTVENLMT